MNQSIQSELFPVPGRRDRRRKIIPWCRRLPGLPEAERKERTLIRLYNRRPTWLANAHRKLDRAVFAAYDWPDDLSDQGDFLIELTANYRTEKV